ncbi:MAG: SprB repeat-containing protein [Flavobacteriales bacterium]
MSCFGKKDGSIDATVTGGTPPYSYTWSNGLSTEDISDLASGYYSLKVVDAAYTMVVVDITLVEPQALTLTAEPFKYPGGTNISCYNCFNGSIDVTVVEGVPPYSYVWDDGPTTQDRSGLGALTYSVLVTDANGCEAVSQKLLLTQPERSDWTMNGNTGTNPATHYIGSADAQDVVFKSNGQPLLRLKSNGDIQLLGSLSGPGVLLRDSNGILRGGGWRPDYPPMPPGSPCINLDMFPPFWETRGNNLEDLCAADVPILGTLSAHPLLLYTDGTERIRIAEDGRVGIGTHPPVNTSGVYRLYVEGGIATRDIKVKTGLWPDFVFDTGYDLMPLSELRAFVQRNRHLPGIPSASEVDTDGGVEVGELQRRMLETIEQQALYILQLEERLQQLEQRVTTLQTSR